MVFEDEDEQEDDEEQKVKDSRNICLLRLSEMRTELAAVREDVINYLRRASAMARRDFLRLAVARVMTLNLTALS